MRSFMLLLLLQTTPKFWNDMRGRRESEREREAFCLINFRTEEREELVRLPHSNFYLQSQKIICKQPCELKCERGSVWFQFVFVPCADHRGPEMFYIFYMKYISRVVDIVCKIYHA